MTVLITTSVSEIEIMGILSVFHAAFPKPSFNVWIKAHPAAHITIEKAFHKMRVDYKECGYEIKKDDMVELLKQATILVSTGGSSQVMALTFRCKVINVLLPDYMNFSPLAGVADNLYTRVTTPKQLKDAVLIMAGFWYDEH